LLEKWRERLRVLSAKPTLPPNVLEQIKNAGKMHRHMEHKEEPKRMVIQRSIHHGEISVPETVARTLTIEKIARRDLSSNEESELAPIAHTEILNSLSLRIAIARREGTTDLPKH